MGGVDKGLVELDGRPMAAHVLSRLAPQVGEVLVNANQNLDRYRALGYPSFPTTSAGSPVACRPAPASRATRDFAVTVPCDSPFLPADLVARPRCTPARRRATRGGEDLRPAASGVRAGARDALPSLAAFLESGGRKIDAWYAALAVVECASTTKRTLSATSTPRRLSRPRK
jgi:molybdopterin-guanine dinucleotide biosynthesis protein A